MWEGLWLEPGDGWENDGIITVRIVDRETGALKVGRLETDYRSYKTRYVFIRETGEYVYANVTDGETFEWLRLKVSQNYMLVWFPRAEKFEEAVNRGILPGLVTNHSGSTTVHLTDLTKEQMALITADEQYFVGPMVLIKVGRLREELADWPWLDDD